MLRSIGRNAHQDVIDDAVRAATNAVHGVSGAGNAGSTPPPGDILTRPGIDGYTRHAFMIGLDAIGDQSAAFFKDGKSYNFGY